ncbi:aldo/keto reductase [Deinococcus sp. UYEF24]
MRPAQLAQAQTITPIMCVQNMYNVAQCSDDACIDDLARQGVAYVPFFPLGGFSPLQSDTLNSVAAVLESSSNAVALVWLLQRSPSNLLIPGTSLIEHLRENIAAAALTLPDDVIAQLETIGAHQS